MPFTMEPKDFEKSPEQDSGQTRTTDATNHFQLYNRETEQAVPLKQVGFSIDICQGFADFVMHQSYENPEENPLEITFMMPTSDNFVLSEI